jgi:DNA polymerase III delta prime subunit
MHNFRLKYAPKTLDDVVFPSQAAKQIIMDMVEHKRLSHLILYGPYGTGKTTVAELIPSTIFGKNNSVDCKFFSADSNSSVSDIRDLKSFIGGYCFDEMNLKFIIIDEVDGLSLRAQHALRASINFADENNVYFIMTTNHIEKLDGGLKSRCELIKFDDFNSELWLPRLKFICQQEGITVEDDNDLLDLISGYGADSRALMRKLEAVIRQANASVV